MRKFLLIRLAILIAISGCLPVTSPKPVINPAENESRVLETISPEPGTPVRIPSGTPLPTQTQQVSSATATVTIPLWQEVKSTGSIPSCNPKGTSASQGKDSVIPGTIIYQRYPFNGLFAADGRLIQTDQSLIPEVQPVHVFGVSPDGNWVAYSLIPQSEDKKLEAVDPIVVLLAADGKKLERTIDLDLLRKADRTGYELESFVGGYWLDNHTIFTYVNSKIPGGDSLNGSQQVGLFFPAVLDVFTGSLQTILWVALQDMSGLFGVSISPDQKHFLSADKGVALQEISEQGANTLLWRDKQAQFAAFDFAAWSPDSSLAVFDLLKDTEENPIHLLLTSKDGQMVKEITGPMSGKFIKDFYWSPNSQYFAFVFRKSDFLTDLLIFDVAQDKFVLDCPLATDADYLPKGIVWSPDSVWIALSEYNEPLKVLNTNNGQLTQTRIVGKAVGWSNLFKTRR